jgi:hypothetical protein
LTGKGGTEGIGYIFFEGKCSLPVRWGGSLFNVASKDESATENFTKFSHTQFVLTRAPERGQIDRDEARSKIGAQENHAGDMPAGKARGFRRGCLSLEV